MAPPEENLVGAIQAGYWAQRAELIEIFGAPGRIRTCDRRIRSPLLYPLSYRRFYYNIN
jgi:hypothetical protein